MNTKYKLSLATILASAAALAAVPAKWTVETSRVQPVAFDAVRGESVALEATLQSYGRPLAMPTNAAVALWWQTNGMETAWWSAPATVVSSNVLTAVFTPEMDCGAKVYNCFLGSTGTSYRAAFQLRFRQGPGAVPNRIEQPPRILDLATTTVVNPPWPTDATIDARIRTVIETDHITAITDTNAVRTVVTGTVDRDYVESLGISGGSGGGAPDYAVVSNAAMSAAAATNDFLRQSTFYPIKVDLARKLQNCADDGASSQYPFVRVSSSGRNSGKLVKVSMQMVPFGNRVETEEPYALESDTFSISETADQALAYSVGTFNYMNGNTNCYFSGTNYVVDASATNRTHFAWLSGMDAATVPCSMALWEWRNGSRQCVWDQRDWTVWYWNFKIAQYRQEHDSRDAELRALINQRCPLAWSTYTACGITNPAVGTTWIDTPTVTLCAGYAWQHQVDIEGVGYWAIEGNGCEIGGSGTNAILRISDWEGNEVLKIRKGNSNLVPVTGESFISHTGPSVNDEYANVVIKTGKDNTAPQPIGEFAAVCDTSMFYPEGDSCPADHSYVYLSNGLWRCSYRLKSGIDSIACFARFKVQRGSQTTVEYSNAPTLNGGIIFNGVKIAPVIPANASTGTTITWQVVQ